MTVRSLSIPALALLLLTGVGAERCLLHVPPAQADAHHLCVQTAMSLAPLRVGDWLGGEAAAPAWFEGLAMPHVGMVRRYVNAATGDAATVALLHCRDARDMLEVDPAQVWSRDGWTVLGTQPAQWRVQQQTVPGTIFTLIRPAERGGSRLMTVCTMFALPEGVWVSDVAGVESAGAHYTRRYFGAAQVQIILDGDPASDRRNAAVHAMLEAFHPVLTTIRSGAES